MLRTPCQISDVYEFISVPSKRHFFWKTNIKKRTKNRVAELFCFGLLKGPEPPGWIYIVHKVVKLIPLWQQQKIMLPVDNTLSAFYWFWIQDFYLYLSILIFRFWYFYLNKESFFHQWIYCSKNVSGSIMPVLLAVCIPLLCSAGGAWVIWPSSWPTTLQDALWLLWCRCPVIIVVTAAG